jgi:hypothetical protein
MPSNDAHKESVRRSDERIRVKCACRNDNSNNNNKAVGMNPQRRSAIRPPAASFHIAKLYQRGNEAAWSSRESRVDDLRRGGGVHPLLRSIFLSIMVSVGRGPLKMSDEKNK